MIYFRATINNRDVHVETTEDLIGKLYDHFTDNGYEISKIEEEEFKELLRDGEVVYHAKDSVVVDQFIENNNKAKAIRNGH